MSKEIGVFINQSVAYNATETVICVLAFAFLIYCVKLAYE